MRNKIVTLAKKREQKETGREGRSECVRVCMCVYKTVDMEGAFKFTMFSSIHRDILI